MNYEQLNYQEIQAFDVRVKYRRMPLHIHNVHEMFFCYDGAGEQLISNGVEPMMPGELFFFPAGDPHRGSGAKGLDCIGAVINFGEDSFYGLSEGGKDLLSALHLLRRWTVEKNHRIPLLPHGSQRVGELFKSMVEENRQRQPGYRGALLIQLMQILLTTLRDSAFPSAWLAQEHFSAEEKIEYGRVYLEKNCFRAVSVAEVCGELGISRSRFHAEFLRHTGTTMTEYLNRLRCRQAVRMLRENKYETEEIIRYCGFGSPASFYRTIRRETGLKPHELRGHITTNIEEPGVKINSNI